MNAPEEHFGMCPLQLYTQRTCCPHCEDSKSFFLAAIWRRCPQGELCLANAPYSVVNGTLMAGEGAGNAQAISFDYNASGLRVQKTVDGISTDYTLHGKLITHLKRGSDEMHFFYDAQGGPAMVDFNGTHYTYVHNLQGDIVAIVDNTGTMVVKYAYDAWGKPIGNPWTLTSAYADLARINPFRYRGYVWDEETGLYYLRSRYYNPTHGRFVNADTTEIFDDTNDQLLECNLFTYCSNNPVYRIDEDGAFWKAIAQAFQMVTTIALVVAATAITVAAVSIGAGVIVAGAAATVAVKALAVAGVATVGYAMAEVNGYIFAKGGKQRISDTGLVGVSNEEISYGLRHKSALGLSSKEVNRLVKEEKSRGRRDKQRRESMK